MTKLPIYRWDLIITQQDCYTMKAKQALQSLKCLFGHLAKKMIMNFWEFNLGRVTQMVFYRQSFQKRYLKAIASIKESWRPLIVKMRTNRLSKRSKTPIFRQDFSLLLKTCKPKVIKVQTHNVALNLCLEDALQTVA